MGKENLFNQYEYKGKLVKKQSIQHISFHSVKTSLQKKSFFTIVLDTIPKF